MSITLATVLRDLDLREYKVHLASWNGETHPLDAFVRDRNEWMGWNTWRYGRDRFNRRFIFSLMRFYHEPDIWLFEGIYKVISRSPEDCAHSYEVELDPTAAELIGRLKIRFKRSRNDSIKLENVYSEMVVSEILRESYSGEQFPGYEIFKSNKQDWKAALENVKGVYLIMDKHNGKKYVGSAYGDFGIWARWACYMGTGHGWNDRLTNYWKEALLSRGKYGYNGN